jgi:histidine triad (HIT) family protein
MSTIFNKIIKGEIPSIKVYEDDICIVIMDKFPSVEGQTLVIPKEEVDYVFDLLEETYQHIFSVAKKVAKASDEAFATERTCIVVEGFEVPHVHIRLYPITDTTESLAKQMSSLNEKDDKPLTEEASKIKKFLV